MSLFRREVLEHRSARLHGDVTIAVPVSWQVIGYSGLAALLALFLFLLSAGYARVETVSGRVAPDRGVVAIMPIRPGVVVSLPAGEGAQVGPGAVIARIGAGEHLLSGGAATTRLLADIQLQEASLADQSAQLVAAAAAEESRLQAQISGLQQELTSLDRQIEVQSDLIASAASEVELLRSVASRGFISRRDVLAREEMLLGRRQRLSELGQLRAGKAASLAQSRRSVAQVRAQAAAQVAGIDSGRAELAQRRTATQQEAGYVLTAPVGGTVTAVTARIGQSADPEQPLMNIVPRGAQLRAELYVPTRAAGFLAVGQPVRLSVDAFPSARFGTVPARISSISAVTVPREAADGRAEPVYLVTAQLEQTWIGGFGRRQPLLPGMLLTARIVTEERSLMEWLFEPLFAVGSR